jgi:ABC-type multidrug transport system fused ATPase/permease subunit
VGERGVRLSGGEKQRVGIARAYVSLLAGAEVLVLDEATSSLDSQSEKVVQEFIERLRGEREIIIVAIAHRLSTIQKADVICVLDSGRITETGDHDQLLRKNGLYKRLVDLQKLGEIRE